MKIFAALCCLLAILSAAHAAGPVVDNAAYAGLLEKHVRGGLVDYKGLLGDKAVLEGYLDKLAQVDPEALSGDARYAFYMNVYNAWTLKLILDHYPVTSIRDITIRSLSNPLGDRWNHRFVRLKSGTVSLNHVEHDILRPQFKDPRVHFAVNCASMGCPPLHHKPFEAQGLDATLDALAKGVINDPRHTRLEGRRLFVSWVFDWFGGDWGGKAEKVAFVLKYAAPELAQAIRAQGDRLELDYAEWDWSLNEAR